MSEKITSNVSYVERLCRDWEIAEVQCRLDLLLASKRGDDSSDISDAICQKFEAEKQTIEERLLETKPESLDDVAEMIRLGLSISEDGPTSREIEREIFKAAALALNTQPFPRPGRAETRPRYGLLDFEVPLRDGERHLETAMQLFGDHMGVGAPLAESIADMIWQSVRSAHEKHEEVLRTWNNMIDQRQIAA